MTDRQPFEISRRDVLASGVGTVAVAGVPATVAAAPVSPGKDHPPMTMPVTLKVNGTRAHARARSAHDAARRAARASAPDRHQEGLRSRPVRRLHGHRRGAPDQQLPDAGGDARRRRDHHDRGARHARTSCTRCRRRSSSMTAISAAIARRARSARRWRCSTRSRPASRATSAPTSTASPALDGRPSCASG